VLPLSGSYIFFLFYAPTSNIGNGAYNFLGSASSNPDLCHLAPSK